VETANPRAEKTAMWFVTDAVTDPQFLLWGTAYMVLKWTVGLWTFRRVRAWSRARPR